MISGVIRAGLGLALSGALLCRADTVTPPGSALVLELWPVRAASQEQRETKAGRRLENLNELQNAIFKAWGRRTERELRVAAWGESLTAAKAAAATGAPVSNNPGRRAPGDRPDYAITTTYTIQGERAKLTSKITTVHEVDVYSAEQNIDPEANDVFGSLAEKLVDGLLTQERMQGKQILVYHIFLCRVEVGTAGQTLEIVRHLILEDLKSEELYHVEVHEQPNCEGQTHAADRGKEAVLVFQAKVMFEGDMGLILLSAENISASAEIHEEKELRDAATRKTLILRLCSELERVRSGGTT